ncbi:MAG: cupin domain-containing protein [Longimicrobiales bacterium]
MRFLRVIPWLLVAVSSATAQAPASEKTSRAIVALPGAITWTSAPTSLPAGAELAVIEGDPSQPGEFTMRLKMPAGYRIPPHFHPATEHVTVLQGTFFVGMGDRFDEKQGTRLPVGAFGALPAGMRHYAWTQGETIIQLHGTGPWGLTYVNAADDPRNRK